MWEEIIKSGKKSVNRVLFKNITYDVMIEYIEENFTLDEPIGQYMLDKEQIKLSGVQKLREMEKPSIILTAYHSWFRNSFDKTVLPLLRKMARLGVLEQTGRQKNDDIGRSFYTYKRTSSVIKSRALSQNKTYFRTVMYETVKKYIEENLESDDRVFIDDIDSVREEIINMGVEKIREDGNPNQMGGNYKVHMKSQFKNQIPIVLNKLVRFEVLEKLGSNVKYGDRNRTAWIKKSKEYGESPKKISPEMEEDIDYVTGENEYENNPTLSDKIKQILQIPYKDKDKPPKYKPDIENMDSGCGCGCDGKEVSKASSQCTKRTKKTSSTRKGKKWMACVPNGKGGYKRVHWGQRGVSVTGKRGNTKRKKSFRARHKCSTCKGGDYSARCMACRDW